MNLLMWLCKELSMDCYHEPYNNSLGPSDLLTKQNLIVKEFPDTIENNCTISFDEFVNTFDYVILLIRNNTYNASISATFMRSPERGDVHVHNIYTVDEKWIDKNQKEILIRQKELEDRIQKLKSINKGILVSYENIYEHKSDIDLIKKYLNIQTTKFVDILDYKYKLRDGKIGIPEEN